MIRYHLEVFYIHGDKDDRRVKITRVFNLHSSENFLSKEFPLVLQLYSMGHKIYTGSGCQGGELTSCLGIKYGALRLVLG
jgi:hypothetical protein